MIKLTSNVLRVKNQVNKKLNRVKVRLPDAAYTYCMKARDNLRIGMRGHRWTGVTEAGMVVHRKSAKESSVYAPIEAVYLDRMKPHHVKLREGSIIRLWAYSKGNEVLRAKADKQGTIFVRPHPFIDNALELTRHEMKGILLNKVKQ